MKTPEIFVSYAWEGESDEIVDELDRAFQKENILLIRDKKDLGFKGIITEFMQRIGEGMAVVTVISDKYLKSPYCMFELLEIYRNLNFKNRIFPIVLEDANIFDPLTRLSYLEYWQTKMKALDNAIMQFGVSAITVIGEDYKMYKKIFDNYGEVVNILKDINSLTPGLHRANNFGQMIEAVKKIIYEETAGEMPLIENKIPEESKRMSTSLSNIHDRRKKDQLQRLEKLYKLLDAYENKLTLSESPKERMLSENEIDKLKEQIEKVESEITNI